jgi:hypothetical protein
MRTTAEIARDALRNLDERGWNQGGTTGANGEWCMAMAMHQGAGSTLEGTVRAYQEAWRLICRPFPDRADPGVTYAIGMFNDHPHTTEEDVRLILKLMAGE